MPVTSSEENIRSLLASLHDTPITTEGTTQGVLEPIYDYLMKIPRDTDRIYHWYCSKASPVAREAATFLIRLFAYNSPRVDAWTSRLRLCLHSCCGCNKSFQIGKDISRSTYFGAFSPEVLDDFFINVDKWELKVSLEAIDKFRSPSGSNKFQPFTDLPSPVLYHLVANTSLLADPKIMSLLRAMPMKMAPLDWPRPLPAGLLLLMMDEKKETRAWAQEKAKISTSVFPVPIDDFTNSHKRALKTIVDFLNLTELRNPGDNGSPSAFRLALESSARWSGLLSVMRYLPPEVLAPGQHCSFDLRRVVLRHVGDMGSHYPDILHCFLVVLQRLGSRLWEGEGLEFALIVFDSMKENPSFSEILQSITPLTDKPWPLSWFAPYLSSVSSDDKVYNGILEKMVGFLVEELQHEQFGSLGPVALNFAAKLLSSLNRKTASQRMSRNLAISSIIEANIKTFISVAFSSVHLDLQWTVARTSSRELVSSLMMKDVEEVQAAITRLMLYISNNVDPERPPVIRDSLWKTFYDTLQITDFDGVAMILNIIAGIAHVDRLSKEGFSPASRASTQAGVELAEKVYQGINRSLTVIQEGFFETISKVTNCSASVTILELIRQGGVSKDVTKLMLSPVDSLHLASQALLGQAFDADVRVECFRAVLENVSDLAIEGICEFLEKFVVFTPIVAEACNLSKSLVRCLTDIIEVLCANPDGLLLDPVFLRSQDKHGPASKIPKLWNLMTRASAAIFKRTPLWAPYFGNDEMIVWMRDALIFGREMLGQRRVFEKAATTHAHISNEKSSKQPSVSKKMVNDLQDVFLECIRWLRLTDEELLHQSFTLLQSFMETFRESHTEPSRAGKEKLTKLINDSRKNDPTRPQSRLGITRLEMLESGLAAFAEDDADVEVITHKLVQEFKPVLPGTKPIVVSQKTAQSANPPRNSRTERSEAFKATAEVVRRQRIDNAPSVNVRQSNVPKSSVQIQPSYPAVKNKNDEKPKASSPPVSASSESESDSEDDQGGTLAALGKIQKSPKVKKALGRRQVKMIDLPLNGKSSIRGRLEQRDDARRTERRLKPDISGLHRIILSWNYDHPGPDPPVNLLGQKLLQIPDHFSDFSHYRRVFEPLLVLESWSQLVKSKDEVIDSYPCNISSRGFVDDWLDLDIQIGESVKKDWFLSDSDLVLLKRPDGGKSVLAKVKSYFARPHGITATIRCLLPGGGGDPGLSSGTTWHLSKVFNLTTLHREYSALIALPYYDLNDSILHPQLSPIRLADPREVKNAMETHRLNEPQANAILSSLKTDGFSLIQGPPGTGKTSTICGLVSAFLEARPRPATVVQVGRKPSPSELPPAKKILLCAPSNAAIDEVAHRLKEGFRDSTGRTIVPKLVRIGGDRTINVAVKEVSLEYLVEQKLSADPASKGQDNDPNKEILLLRRELESVKQLRQQKVEEMSNIRDDTARTMALDKEIKALHSQRVSLIQKVDRLKDKQKNDSRTLDATRRRVRREVLREADIICSTLSGAGQIDLEEFEFETVVIDEAAQAIELSSLIPLRYKCRRCILVGDPQQLAPTVFSQHASKFQYEQSLFVRLQRSRPNAVHLLSIQYRMHPDISRLPSQAFYQGRLLDGPEMDTKTKQPWHSNPMFGPYKFFNVAKGQEESGQAGRSYKNIAECQVSLALFTRLTQENKSTNFDFRVGIVSMYKSQITEIRRAFAKQFGSDIVGRVDFNTVDGFQGQEKDIIILSCVRAGPNVNSIGFLSDIRRMNVALTRARSSLFVLGNGSTLSRSDDTWRKIIDDSRSRSSFIDVDATYFASPGPTFNKPHVGPRKIQARKLIQEALPEDLSIPSEYIQTVNRPNVNNTECTISESMESATPILDVSNALVESPANGETLEDRKHPAGGGKRNIKLAQSSLLVPDESQKQKRPPTQKRPKTAPNLFIPKLKTNKRPAPERDDGAGPSTNRRRI